MEEVGWSSLHKILSDITRRSILQFACGGTQKGGRAGDGGKYWEFQKCDCPMEESSKGGEVK